MKTKTILFMLTGIAVINAEIDNLYNSPKLVYLPFNKKTVKPKIVSHINKRDGNYTTSLYNGFSFYLITVGIGSPTQNFQMVLDTGSADLWVASSQCPDSECPVARFSESNSSTYQSLSNIFNITYGIGDAHGIYATDTVTIGGATVNNQQLGLATATSSIFTNLQTIDGDTYTPTNTSSEEEMSGVFGLGYPFITASQQAYNTFFFNLIDQKIINNYIFSIYLNSLEEQGKSGQIIFGGVDSTKYSGDLQYVPVAKTTVSTTRKSGNGYGFWQVLGQGFDVINGEEAYSGPEISSPIKLIIDTGTTLTYLPSNVVTSIMKSIAGSTNNLEYDSLNGYYKIGCSSSLAKSDTKIQLKLSTASSAISTNPVLVNIPLNELIIPMDTDYIDTASVCILGLIPSSTGTSFIGDSMLRSLYMVFDAGQDRIGIAGAVGSASSVTGGGSSDISTATNSNKTSESQSIYGFQVLKQCLFSSLVILIVLLY